MIHHKQHGKKRTLVLLLAGSVLFTNIPVSANAVSDIELSADESASDETANTGNTATNDAVDISIDSIDENTASSTVDDSSELQSAALMTQRPRMIFLLMTMKPSFLQGQNLQIAKI
ncbi:hypothetical protein DXB38_06030 [Blautia obeum]|uniref:Uncharacterized protein n=1 Tax=Blautia obeum TaxID=40520 RepID=A0A3E5EI02_9FIRM|nr:hypothetical protein DXB38_06030 [Blautia obeum]